MTRRSLGLTAATLALAVLPATPAAAAPVTVNLRIEGPTRTLFEGPVTTDVRPFQFPGDPVSHQCDGTAANTGTSPVAVPTRGAAITAASQAAPFSMTGTFSVQFGSPSFDAIAGESVAFDAATNRFLAEYENGVAAQVGSCADPIANGDDVLFAYGTGADPLLKLAGPATAAPGAPVALRVTDLNTGAPVAGAAVEGQTSGADGTVTVGPYDVRGDRDLKASKAGSIRSNRVRVCVTDGADGACGTTVAPVAGAGAAPSACLTSGDDGNCGTVDRRPPVGKIASVREGQRFAKGKGPRVLAGIVAADPSGLADVRLRLTRTDAGRCTTYDARTERFAAMTRCGAKRGRWFSVGARAQWSYLLPSALAPGRYVLDVEARDRAGNRDTLLQRTRTRVVFEVA
ncbi:MAG: hypothetical protein QOC78_3462 [Solirubrobacteraceae bacterium]|jgi:hypothetical protein|nr:hypothetical protein [Solirubrobacteraceae bacterium]